jgi:uncharacterized Zn-binding protein involved in type VI secretion
MPFAARQGDPSLHPGAIGAGAPNVLINGRPAARRGDPFACALPPVAGPHPLNFIAKGSATVTIAGKDAARVGDSSICGAIIAAGSPNVLIGG